MTMMAMLMAMMVVVVVMMVVVVSVPIGTMGAITRLATPRPIDDDWLR